MVTVGMWIPFSCKVAPFLFGGSHLVPNTLAEVVTAWTSTCLNEITAGLVSFVRTGHSGKASRLTGGKFNIPKWISQTSLAKAPVCFLTQFPQPPGEVEEKWTEIQEKILLLTVIVKLLC